LFDRDPGAAGQLSSATYQDLLDRVRLRLATRLLASGRPIGEVASSVGFSQASTFHRAFKSWTGQTPTEYQQRCMEDARGPATAPPTVNAPAPAPATQDAITGGPATADGNRQAGARENATAAPEPIHTRASTPGEVKATAPRDDTPRG
jgi:hypothetical protein